MSTAATNVEGVAGAAEGEKKKGSKLPLILGLVDLYEATFDDGLLIPPLDFARSDKNLLLVEIPADIQALKAASKATASNL